MKFTSALSFASLQLSVEFSPIFIFHPRCEVDHVVSAQRSGDVDLHCRETRFAGIRISSGRPLRFDIFHAYWIREGLQTCRFPSSFAIFVFPGRCTKPREDWVRTFDNAPVSTFFSYLLGRHFTKIVTWLWRGLISFATFYVPGWRLDVCSK